MKRIMMLVLIVMLMVSCKTHKDGQDWYEDSLFCSQKILFEAEYENQAWAPQHYGKYIDNQGNVFRYELGGAQWPHSGKVFLTEEELMSKYAVKEQIGTLDMNALYEKYQSIASLAPPAASQTQDLGCRDFGVVVYSAYKYDPGSMMYERVFLLLCGDGFRVNDSPVSMELGRWISVVLRIMTSYGESCCTPPAAN